MSFQHVLKVPANELGRDFVVSDIHGYFTKVMLKLTELGFDEEKDRLFSVGDLVDRGEENHLALEWLDKPWFFAVRGNHEQLLIDSYKGDKYSYRCHFTNGGKWFHLLSDDDEKLRYCERFDDLPYVIEIGGKYGIVHAEPPLDNWQNIVDFVHRNSGLRDACIWSRGRIEYNVANTVKGIYWVYCGHTRIKKPKLLGNIWFIETCVSHPKGYLTVMEIGKH